MAVLQEIKVPLISVNDTSLTIAEMCFSAGDKVKEGDIILVFETSKTTYDIVAEADGYIEYFCQTEIDYHVNEVVAKIYSAIPDAVTPIKLNGSLYNNYTKEVVKKTLWTGTTLFSKGALKLIQEKEIDQNIFFTCDFINREDVQVYLNEKTPKTPLSLSSKQAKLPESISRPVNGNIITEKLSINKRKEIEYLSSVQVPGLTSTINTYIETDGIFIHLNENLQALKNSLLPVTIYEISRLLHKYKQLNAYYDDGAILFYNDVNIGFAIDIGKGLKVLKVANAQNKTIRQIETDILDLSGKYLDEALSYTDLSDITFTITDLSSESVAFFRPLINSMNSAILGMSSIDEKLNRCIFSITFDHRVTEGKLVASFLKELQGRLESYRSHHNQKKLRDINCFKCLKNLDEDLSDVGLAQCITPKGESAFICQSCLKGF